MSTQTAEYDQLQADAAKTPAKLIQAIAERDGEDEGGLTLSREHIITLNRYVNFVFGLPSTPDNLQRWLGYTQIDEPELAPAGMTTLFDALRGHARSWGPLSDSNKKLASELASTAASINAAGETIVDECRQIRALGSDIKAWDKVVLGTPVKLDRADQRAVSSLVDYLQILQEDVQRYAVRVATVRGETETFRDAARFKLIPAVKQKGQAVERTKGDGEVERLRVKLKELDDEIGALSKEYDQYVKQALSGLAAGPIGAVITGGIYGSKAEKVRKERKRRQAERRATSEQLRVRVNLEGRMEEMATFVDELDTRLQDVVTAASHLQTAWEIVGAYIDASIGKLEQISDNRALARFVIYFRQFLAQWNQIEKTSLQLTRIFDDAASAH